MANTLLQRFSASNIEPPIRIVRRAAALKIRKAWEERGIAEFCALIVANLVNVVRGSALPVCLGCGWEGGSMLIAETIAFRRVVDMEPDPPLPEMALDDFGVDSIRLGCDERVVQHEDAATYKAPVDISAFFLYNRFACKSVRIS